MPITKVISFGFKRVKDLPVTKAQIFDVRHLDNPYSNPQLRESNGLQEDVQEYVRKDTAFESTLTRIMRSYHDEGFPTIAIGCTGGRHRSVVVAEELARRLGVPVEHRDISKE